MQPLFHTDLELLKKRVRLADLPVNKNGITIFEEGIQSSRVFFYRRLGQDRITQILSYGNVKDAPATANEYMRLMAALCEVKVVKKHLAIHCNMLVQDAGDSSLQKWNEEGAFRESSPFELNSYIKKLDNEIEDDIDFLKGEETPGSENLIRASTFEPDETPPRPFDSIGFEEW